MCTKTGGFFTRFLLKMYDFLIEFFPLVNPSTRMMGNGLTPGQSLENQSNRDNQSPEIKVTLIASRQLLPMNDYTCNAFIQ